MQTFSFMDEKDYLNGKELCLVQLRLDDTIFIQRRSYAKIGEIFSKIGGYMQLLHTIFSLLALLINKFDSEIKIITGIFNFNIEKNKMALKYQSLRDFDSIILPSYNKNLIFSSRKSIKDNSEFQNKSNNNLIIMSNNISSIFNLSNSKKNFEDCQSSKLEINKKRKNSIFESIDFKKTNKIKKSKFCKSNNEDNNVHKFKYNNSINKINKINYVDLPKLNLVVNKKESNNNLNLFTDQISLNLLDYLCKSKKKLKKAQFDLYNLGIRFYKKTMDLVHVFTLLLITERILLKKNK